LRVKYQQLFLVEDENDIFVSTSNSQGFVILSAVEKLTKYISTALDVTTALKFNRFPNGAKIKE